MDDLQVSRGPSFQKILIDRNQKNIMTEAISTKAGTRPINQNRLLDPNYRTRFQSLIGFLSSFPSPFIITGEFIIHMDTASSIYLMHVTSSSIWNSQHISMVFWFLMCILVILLIWSFFDLLTHQFPGFYMIGMWKSLHIVNGVFS
jgi:hypothetical protein